MIEDCGLMEFLHLGDSYELRGNHEKDVLNQ